MSTALITQPRSEEAVIEAQYFDKLRSQISLRRVLFVVCAVLGLAVLAPVLISAVQAGLALVALGGLAVAALVAWRYLPLMMLRVENDLALRIMAEKNAHLTRLKNEARKNPIEQAQNDYLRRLKQYETFKTAMETIGGQVESLGSRLAQMKRKRPQADYSQQEQAVSRMELFYTNRKDRLQDAFVKLGRFKETIDEASDKWQFQLVANEAIRAMNATDQDSKIQEILTEVSFAKVQQEFDGVFAKIDIDAAEMAAQRQLDFGTGIAIDMSAISLPTPVAIMKGSDA